MHQFICSLRALLKRRVVPGGLFSGVLIAHLLSLGWSVPAAARTVSELPYAYDLCWPTAVRFLRVDNRFLIEEKDKETGYILFRFGESEDRSGKPLGSETPASSLELVATNQKQDPDQNESASNRDEYSGRDKTRISTKFILDIPSQPRSTESLLLEKLRRKLLEDYGRPSMNTHAGRTRRKATDKTSRTSSKRDSLAPAEPPEPGAKQEYAAGQKVTPQREDNPDDNPDKSRKPAGTTDQLPRAPWGELPRAAHSASLPR